MYTLITVLIIIACALMILIVLVQNSKGGGLASNFQSTNQIMGVRKTTDFLEKATWTLAGVLLFLSVLGSAFIPRTSENTNESAIQQQVDEAVDTSQDISFPVSTGDETEEAPAADETPAE